MLLALGLGGLCAGIAVQPTADPQIAWVVLVGGGVCLLCFRRSRLLPALGLVLVAAGVGSVTAGLHSPSSALRGAAARVPPCALTARVLEQTGALGTLLAVERVVCPEIDLTHAGVVMLDDHLLAPGSVIETRGWLLPLTDEPYDVARARAGARQRGIHRT